METENTENLDSTNEETTADAETTDEVDVDALKAQAAKASELEDANRKLFERAKKAEGFVKVDGKWVKGSKETKPRTEDAPAPKAPTGELDETQLELLDLKGISEDEDLDVIRSVMQRTGQTLRQTLRDDYVKSKLESNKAQRDLKAATPSATKRGGNQVTDLNAAVAKFEQTGVLPDDFALRTAVVNAIADKSNTNKPRWH